MEVELNVKQLLVIRTLRILSKSSMLVSLRKLKEARFKINKLKSRESSQNAIIISQLRVHLLKTRSVDK